MRSLCGIHPRNFYSLFLSSLQLTLTFFLLVGVLTPHWGELTGWTTLDLHKPSSITYPGYIGLTVSCGGIKNGQPFPTASCSTPCQQYNVCGEDTSALSLMGIALTTGFLSSFLLILSSIIKIINYDNDFMDDSDNYHEHNDEGNGSGKDKDNEDEWESSDGSSSSSRNKNHSSWCRPSYKSCVPYFKGDKHVITNYYSIYFATLSSVVNLLFTIIGFGVGYHALINNSNDYIQNHSANLIQGDPVQTFHAGWSASFIIMSIMGMVPLNFLLCLHLAFTNKGGNKILIAY